MCRATATPIRCDPIRAARSSGRSIAEHRLTGTRASAVELVGARLEERQRAGEWVLVRGVDDVEPVVASGIVQARRSGPGPALLVRPDGYVAWAGRVGRTGPGGWRAVRQRWTGGGAEPVDGSVVPHPADSSS